MTPERIEELAATAVLSKSAMRQLVKQAIAVAVDEAIAEERASCEKLAKRWAAWDVAKAIRARGE